MENQIGEKELHHFDNEERSNTEIPSTDNTQETPLPTLLDSKETPSHSNVDKNIVLETNKVEPIPNNIFSISDEMDEDKKLQANAATGCKLKVEIVSNVSVNNASLTSTSSDTIAPDHSENIQNTLLDSTNTPKNEKKSAPKKSVNNQNKKSVGLALIAGYSGDSEDSESSSESSSMEDQSSSSSSSDTELEFSVRKIKVPSTQSIDYTCNKFQKANTKAHLSDSESSDMEIESEESEDSDSDLNQSTAIKSLPARLSKVNLGPRTKGEMRLCDLPPIENLHISIPEQECIELGTVTAVVEELVVVQALREMPPLNIDSVLFLNKGKETLGKIFDVFGPVNEPCYAIRFNSVDEIAAKNIDRGTKVYCAPRTHHSSFVLVSNLMKSKGSDASWKEDNEPPENHIEFSDDEEEKRWRAKHRGRPNADESPNDFEKRKNQRNLQLNAHFQQQKYNPPNPQTTQNNYWNTTPYAGLVEQSDLPPPWPYALMSTTHNWFTMPPPPPPPSQEIQETSIQIPDGNANAFQVHDYPNPSSSQK